MSGEADMEAQDIILIISAVTTSLVVLFTAWDNRRSNQRVETKVDETKTVVDTVETLVNSKSDKADKEITELKDEVRSLRAAALGKSDAALEKSEARESPPRTKPP